MTCTMGAHRITRWRERARDWFLWGSVISSDREKSFLDPSSGMTNSQIEGEFNLVGRFCSVPLMAECSGIVALEEFGNKSFFELTDLVGVDQRRSGAGYHSPPACLRAPVPLF